MAASNCTFITEDLKGKSWAIAQFNIIILNWLEAYETKIELKALEADLQQLPPIDSYQSFGAPQINQTQNESNILKSPPTKLALKIEAQETHINHLKEKLAEIEMNLVQEQQRLAE